MHPGVIAAPAGVVDAGSRDPNRPGDAAPAEGDVGAADFDAETGPGARNVDRQAGKDVDAAIEAEAAHQFSPSALIHRRAA